MSTSRFILACLLSLSWMWCVHASSEEALFRGIELRDLSAVAASLKAGASVTVTNARGWPPLVLAAKQGDLAVAKLLVEHGADVNARSSAAQGSYVVHFAASSGDCGLMRFLASKGASFDRLQLAGNSPIASAIATRRPDAVECLLSLGVDPDAPCMRGENGEWVTPLGLAALRQDTNMAIVLLKHGAGIERPSSYGNTPLMLAARGTDRGAVVRWFLEQGADAKARGPQGHSALIFAAFHGDGTSVEVLLAAGGDPRALAYDAELEGVIPSAPYTAATVAERSGFTELGGRLREASARGAGKQ